LIVPIGRFSRFGVIQTSVGTGFVINLGINALIGRLISVLFLRCG
jgi:hypothetical protein